MPTNQHWAESAAFPTLEARRASNHLRTAPVDRGEFGPHSLTGESWTRPMALVGRRGSIARAILPAAGLVHLDSQAVFVKMRHGLESRSDRDRRTKGRVRAIDATPRGPHACIGNYVCTYLTDWLSATSKKGWRSAQQCRRECTMKSCVVACEISAISALRADVVGG
jgi:hypothetical protein